MTRDITAAVEAETEASNLNWGLLLELELDNGTVNLWTGATNIIWDSKTWLGVGAMGDLSSGGVETIASTDNRINATLSDIPIDQLPDLITELQDGNPTNRPWSLYLTMLTDDAAVITDPVLTSSGTIDSVSFTDYPIASITLVLSNEAALLKKSTYFLLNDADQDKLYSGDKGMEYAARLDDFIRSGALSPLQISKGGFNPSRGDDFRMNLK